MKPAGLELGCRVCPCRSLLDFVERDLDVVVSDVLAHGSQETAHVGVVAGDGTLKERRVDDGTAAVPGDEEGGGVLHLHLDDVVGALAVADHIVGQLLAHLRNEASREAMSEAFRVERGRGVWLTSVMAALTAGNLASLTLTSPDDTSTTVSDVLMSLSTLMQLKLCAADSLSHFRSVSLGTSMSVRM